MSSGLLKAKHHWNHSLRDGGKNIEILRLAINEIRMAFQGSNKRLKESLVVRNF
jgi:hypothetical protein